jgi:uncharacterized repeat protein (TIGR01451 family)
MAAVIGNKYFVDAARMDPSAEPGRVPGGQSNACALIGPFENPAAVGPTGNNDDSTLRTVKITSQSTQARADFTNTLTNPGSTKGNFVVTAPRIPNGFIVNATFNGQANLVPLNSGGKVVASDVQPGEQRNLTVQITLPSGLTTNTDFDIVIQVTSDTDPNCSNQTIDRVRLDLSDLNCALIGPFENPGAAGPTSNNDDFTLRKLNAALSLPPVGFVNTLTNPGTAPGNFIITAPTIPPGFSVIASIDSGKTFMPLNSGGQLITPTLVNPGEQRNLDVRITPPTGLAVNTDFDVVIQVATSSNAGCSNRTIDRIRLEPKADTAPPNLSLVKSATDVNGGSLLPGDVVEYSLTISNPSSASVANAFIAEFIPPDVTYVAGSVRITSGANAGAKTDAVRDDQVDYFPPTAGNNGQINIFVGAGAGSNRGGTLAPGESTTAVFRVTVNANLPCNAVINNGADWGGDDFYAAGKSNVSSVTVNCLPDLTITKQHSPNEFTRGQEGSFTLTARNIGVAPTLGTVTVTDAMPAGVQPTAANGTGWSCSITGQTVTCTRSDALAAGASYSAITVNVNVAGTAASPINNTATVSGGGETNTANNSATDQVTAADPPACALIGPFQQPAAVGPTNTNDDFTQRKVTFELAGGVTTVTGSVGFINTLTNTGGKPGQFIITAPIIPAGFTVTASIDSGATFVNLSGGMLLTPTPVNPGEQRNLDVRITVPPGLKVGTNYDVVIQVTSDAGGTCSNRTIDRITPDPVPNPDLKLVKSVVDVNGGAVLPGDVLEYSLTLSNQSSKSAANTFIADFIPTGVSYVANSVRITSGAGSGPDTKTDAIGDDVVDYFPPQSGNNGQLNIFTGKGAAANAVASTDRERRGGTLDPGDSTTVTFRVTVNSGVACGTVINNGAEWGGELIYPGGRSNVASVVTCQATTCQALCFRSAAYFALNPNAIPNGAVLIGGVNGNSKVSTSHPSVRQALRGQFGPFIREHVAAQLNLLNASGLGAANVLTALASTLSCYGLEFQEVALTGAALSPNSKLFDLFQVAEAVAKRDASGQTRDACILTKVFGQLNGNGLSGMCNRTAGSIDFSSCP